jgi:hypothetical protein
MALFFRPYPTTEYRIPGTDRTVFATDITRRFSVSNFINNNTVNFDEYFVQDGDRPDTVAYEYYGDVTLDWLVLLANEIHDPYFEWHMSDEKFESYIVSKYGSLSYAYQTVHHYEWITQEQQLVVESGLQRILPEKTLIVDYTTYASLPAGRRRSISIYDFEKNKNEDNRHIYLIDLHYTYLIKEQHPYVFDSAEGVSIR